MNSPCNIPLPLEVRKRLLKELNVVGAGASVWCRGVTLEFDVVMFRSSEPLERLHLMG